MGSLQRVQRSAQTPQNYFFQRLERMAERKRAQAAKAMEKKTMNPKVFCTAQIFYTNILHFTQIFCTALYQNVKLETFRCQ